MIADWIRDSAARTPDKAAIRFHGRELSYREFAALADDIAAALAAAGVKRGDTVTFLGFNSPEMLALPFVVWSEMTGKEPEEMPLERNPVDLKGKLWEEDEELEVEFPLLFELVGWEDVEEEEEKL